jgi:hypothetical protein
VQLLWLSMHLELQRRLNVAPLKTDSCFEASASDMMCSSQDIYKVHSPLCTRRHRDKLQWSAIR